MANEAAGPKDGVGTRVSRVQLNLGLLAKLFYFLSPHKLETSLKIKALTIFLFCLVTNGI